MSQLLGFSPSSRLTVGTLLSALLLFAIDLSSINQISCLEASSGNNLTAGGFPKLAQPGPSFSQSQAPAPVTSQRRELQLEATSRLQQPPNSPPVPAPVPRKPEILAPSVKLPTIPEERTNPPKDENSRKQDAPAKPQQQPDQHQSSSADHKMGDTGSDPPAPYLPRILKWGFGFGVIG